MAHALQQTSHGDGAGAFSKASLATPSSCLLTPINDHEPRPRPNDAGSADCHSYPATCHLGRTSPACGGKLRDRALPGALPVFHSCTLIRANGSRLQSFAHHSLVLGADARHLSNVLSSSLSSRWIDPNENGLTHAKISFDAGSNAHD